MNNKLFDACFKYDKKQVYDLVMRLGADDFECLVEFRYYDLAVFVFTKNILRNMELLKEFHKSDIVELLNHGLQVHLPEYSYLYKRHKDKVKQIIDLDRESTKLFDENIVKEILRSLPHQFQKTP